MPKLYEYMGIIVLFYSNEHEPIHVHGKYQGRESRAELIVVNGQVVNVIYNDGPRPTPARGGAVAGLSGHRRRPRK